MEKVRQVLFLQNPWWFEPVSASTVPKSRRRLFAVLKENLRDERGLQIVGLRRTGKTTLLLQIIHALMEENVAPRQILYLSADSVELSNVEHPILACFRYFHEQIATKDERLYMFVDEAQFSPTWAQEVKNLWDAFRPKVLVTGSSAPGLLRESRESLAGTMRSFYLGPLSLTEFSEMRDEPIEHDIPPFITTAGRFTPEDFGTALQALTDDPVRYEQLRRVTQPVFHQYLLRGGFPEGVLAEDLRRYRLEVKY